MNKIIILCVTILFVQSFIVTKNDKCNECSQMLQASDCQLFGCQWKVSPSSLNGKCQKFSTTKIDNPSYCSWILDFNVCIAAFGCAYLNGKCTTFAGCSAYTEATDVSCQSISSRCISNGKTCKDTASCEDYDQLSCNAIPDKNGRKCILDQSSNVCRNFTCEEADQTYISDAACNAFSPGCVTKGAGCVSQLQNCSQLLGTDKTCPMMRGIDGKCKFDEGSKYCQLKLCEDAPESTATDASCQQFQDGCVTTGRGCSTKLDVCSNYSVEEASRDCIGYVGTDGICEGDSNEKNCRARNCEDFKGTSNDSCGDYKRGCITDGKKCVSMLKKCENYLESDGGCEGRIGSDGNCSKTTDTGNCRLSDCVSESNLLQKTDEQCKMIQSYCQSTGGGCVSILSSCTEYYISDEFDCFDRIGNEGKCKKGGAQNCVPRLCSDAALTDQNDACRQFQKGCVTNGAGCIPEKSCFETVLETTCIGTKESEAYCNWSATCVDNSSCSKIISQAICYAYKTSTQIRCTWDIKLNQCREAKCNDFEGNNEQQCTEQLQGCVSNGKQCIEPGDCSQLIGSFYTCGQLSHFCWGGSEETTPCYERTCENAPNTIQTDTECIQYKSTCLKNSTGCIDNTSDCSQYIGNQVTCKTFTGYYGQNKRIRCWSNSQTDQACVLGECSVVASALNNNDCQAFSSECIYNGNGSCVNSSAPCTSYGYTNDNTICQHFKGLSGAAMCWQGNNGYCKNKECSDFPGQNPTTEQCQNFLSGCVTNGTQCVLGTLPCTSFTGTIDQCNQLVGNSVKCTKFILCKSRVCLDKTNASSNNDCIAYHTNCRQVQGSTNCMDAANSCTDYRITVSSSAQTYCNSITTKSGTNCSFDQGSNCIARTQCKQWVSGLSVTCGNYLGNNTCVQNTQDNICYAIGSCSSYTIPTVNVSNSSQFTWCSGIYDVTNKVCVYDSKLSTTICSSQSCETINVSANLITSSSGCNKIINGGRCLFYGSKCYTTQAACSSYTMSGITAGQEAAYCTALKQNNNGVVAPCKFISKATTCSTMICTDITTPTSQSSCNSVPGCKYYSSACYQIVACTSYVFPAAINTDALKRLFCQNMYNSGTTNYCTFSTGTTCSVPINDCTGFTGSNVATCTAFRDQAGKICTWTSGTKCSISSNLCTDVPGTVSDNTYCDLRTIPGLCKKATGTTCTANTNTITCTTTAATGTNDTEKASFCAARMNTTGTYCSFSIGGANCAASISSCTSLIVTSTLDNTAFCRASKDQKGNSCTYDLNQTSCRTQLLCETATPGSQNDCDFYSTGCIYYNSSCIFIKTNCNLYLSIGNTTSDKLTYCNNLKSSASQSCTYIAGLYCQDIGTCTSYSVALIKTESERLQSCTSVLTSDAMCTYWNNQSNSCVIQGECSSYILNSLSDCSQIRDKNGKQCIKGATTCSLVAKCEAIQNPNTQSDCDNYLSECIFYQNQCLTRSSSCAYQTQGKNSIEFCNGLHNSKTNQQCTAVSDQAAICQDRTCSDPLTLSMTTNIECSNYKVDCKSNGTHCIDATIQCDKYTPNSCDNSLDYDNITPCQVALLTCIDRTCDQNQIAKTDQECDSYKSGCKTKGLGCIDPSAPCSSYSGTQETCQNFLGNNKKCWGNDDTGNCRDRVCQDNTSSKSDSDCQQFLKDCVTTGTGCVPITSDCSVFQGNQATCQQFKGGLCWNTDDSISTTPCLNKECSLLAGKTDVECAKFIPSNKCVTNGVNCVPSSSKCIDFKGTIETCSQFSAIDGPCKGTTSSQIGDYCQTRICSEAPNKFTTDAECKQYYPTCVTTGQGCVSSTGSICTSLRNSKVCSAKIGCLWANHCRTTPNQCSVLTSQGQSVCVNTTLSDGKTKCAWSSSNECRKFTCEDYDSTFTKHTQCNSMDSSCTTSGAGCVIQGPCSSYTQKSVCSAAKTNEYYSKCFWDDDAGLCKSQSCLNDCETKFVLNCQSFNGNPGACFKDINGLPCQYVNEVCYNYDSCESITSAKSLEECQAFNPLCVLSSNSCIAQRACEEYADKIECTVGIHNTRCGWLPSGKCQTFHKCEEAKDGTNLIDCQNYGKPCITDGINCLSKTICSYYKTQTSCQFDGTDGKCFWDEFLNSCILARCNDFNLTTDLECAQILILDQPCTTDGKICVSRSACTTYTTESSCTVGQDGIDCIYVHKEGESEESKYCRQKQCKDIRFQTNEECRLALKGKRCISNGQQCDSIDLCANYKNQISCRGGGSDGPCAFSPDPIDPSVGTCILFNFCEAAKNDQSVCMSKSSTCQWSYSGSVTNCSPKTCEQAAYGTICNYIPNFNGNEFTICALVNNRCTESDATKLDSSNCFSKSAYSYTWNSATQKCAPCKISNSQNNETNTSSNNQSNQSETSNNSTTTSNNSSWIYFVQILLVLFF